MKKWPTTLEIYKEKEKEAPLAVRTPAKQNLSETDVNDIVKYDDLLN